MIIRAYIIIDTRRILDLIVFAGDILYFRDRGNQLEDVFLSS